MPKLIQRIVPEKIRMTGELEKDLRRRIAEEGRGSWRERLRADFAPWFDDFLLAFDCGDGWQHILRDLTEEIAIIRGGPNRYPMLRVSQLKQKRGTLRFYLLRTPRSAPEQRVAIDAAIARARRQSDLPARLAENQAGCADQAAAGSTPPTHTMRSGDPVSPPQETDRTRSIQDDRRDHREYALLVRPERCRGITTLARLWSFLSLAEWPAKCWLLPALQAPSSFREENEVWRAAIWAIRRIQTHIQLGARLSLPSSLLHYLVVARTGERQNKKASPRLFWTVVQPNDCRTVSLAEESLRDNDRTTEKRWLFPPATTPSSCAARRLQMVPHAIAVARTLKPIEPMKPRRIWSRGRSRKIQSDKDDPRQAVHSKCRVPRARNPTAAPQLPHRRRQLDAARCVMRRPLLTRQQVAERANVTVGWFYRNRQRLEAEGFPKSLPGFTQGRWCPEAIEAWISRHSGAPAPEAAEPETVEDPQEELRQSLQDRAREIARGKEHTVDDHEDAS